MHKQLHKKPYLTFLEGAHLITLADEPTFPTRGTLENTC
jgi:hypothetical protein